MEFLQPTILANKQILQVMVDLIDAACFDLFFVDVRHVLKPSHSSSDTC